MRVSDATLRRRLRARFGHDRFLPGQLDIVRAVMAGRDVLGVLATGSGKSLTYQLPSELLDGVTVVVSPLIALMRDQVAAMRAIELRVDWLASTRSERSNARALERAAAGEVDLLYLTPERLEDATVLAALARAGVALLVVDEAHELSEWGTTFRPAYLRVAQAAEALGRPPVLALTATATPWVRRDIAEALGLREPQLVSAGNDRPNLFLEVHRVEEERTDQRVLHALLHEPGSGYEGALARRLAGAMRGSGIVYTATTRGAAETAAWLRGWGVPAAAYHGRLPKRERSRVQDAFMDGELRVVAATNAFGLGIDKADVRFVVHRDIPGSVEEYAQEAGRAGRDGRFARCTLIYRPGDLGRAAFLSGAGTLERDDVRRFVAGLARGPCSRSELRDGAGGLSRVDVERLVALLKRHGLLAERRRRLLLTRPGLDPEDVPLDAEERRREYERSRVQMARSYAETDGCRREYVLNYFAEPFDARRCRMCDNHAKRPAAVRGGAGNGVPYGTGDEVRHDAWGEGVVQHVDAEAVTVLFDSGYRSLAVDVLRERPELLERR